MVRPSLFAATFVLLVAKPGPAADLAPTTVKGEVLAAWQAAYEHVSAFRSTLTVASYRAPKGQDLVLKRESVLRHAVSGANDLFSYQITAIVPTDGARRLEDAQLQLRNLRYKATLNKSRKDEWLLTKYEPIDQPALADHRTVVLPWTLMANAIMWDWLPDPRVQVTRLERPGGRTIRVHFNFDDESSTSGKRQDDTSLRRGYIDFDESRSFCILGYELTRKSPAGEWIESGTHEYAAAGNGIPVLHKITTDSPETKTLKSGVVSARDVATYELDYNSAVPDEVFWLSHYGLPEPVGVTPPPKKTPRSLLFIGGAVVCAALAVVFMWLANRRRNVAPPTSPAQPPGVSL